MHQAPHNHDLEHIVSQKLSGFVGFCIDSRLALTLYRNSMDNRLPTRESSLFSVETATHLFFRYYFFRYYEL